jgi:hypothetical protein
METLATPTSEAGNWNYVSPKLQNAKALLKGGLDSTPDDDDIPPTRLERFVLTTLCVALSTT